jgi:hypothetical protein
MAAICGFQKSLLYVKLTFPNSALLVNHLCGRNVVFFEPAFDFVPDVRLTAVLIAQGVQQTKF